MIIVVIFGVEIVLGSKLGGESDYARCELKTITGDGECEGCVLF